MNPQLLLPLASIGLGALGFILLWSLVHRSPKPGHVVRLSFDVMERSNKHIALGNPSRFHWFAGLMYASLFYFWLPILIWRYGLQRALGLIIVPIIVSFGIASASTGFMDLNSGERLIFGFVTLLILRAILGVKVVAPNDCKYRRNALVMRGWKVLGSCEATSEREAIKYFQDLFGREPVEKTIRQSKGVLISDIATKICIRCRQEKPLSAFYLKLRDDYVHECIDCRLANSTGQSTSRSTLKS